MELRGKAGLHSEGSFEEPVRYWSFLGPLCDLKGLKLGVVGAGPVRCWSFLWLLCDMSCFVGVRLLRIARVCSTCL